MVGMDSEHILEVPDTPDRIQQPSTCPKSSSVVRSDLRMATANPLPRCRIKIKTRNGSMHASSSQSNACSVHPAPSDTEHIFKHAEAARILALSENLEATLFSQKSDRITGTSVESDKRAEKRGLDLRSSIGGRSHSGQCTVGEVYQQNANHQKANFLGVRSGLPTDPVVKPQNRICSTANTLKILEGVDVCPGLNSGEVKSDMVTNMGNTGPPIHPRVVPQRHMGKKKLVLNGCISPSNIAKRSIKVDEKQEMCSLNGQLHNPCPQLEVYGRGNVIDLTDNSPTITRQKGCLVNDRLVSTNNIDTRVAKRLRSDRAGRNMTPQSEYNASSNNCSEVSLSSRHKGKDICHDISDSKQTVEASTRRVCVSAAETSVVNNNNSVINQEPGWRTTHNHTSKLSISVMGGNNNLSCGATLMAPESLGDKTILIGRGRRKHASTSSHPGESSTAPDEPRCSFFASSKTTATRNYSSRQHDIPIINIDDIPPEAGHGCVTSADHTIQAQLEFDELLARQLQEQLYNEPPRVVPREEIDAIVAMSLQHEEDTHRISRPVRRFQNNTRGGRASRLHSYRTRSLTDLEAANNGNVHLQSTAPITLGLGAIFARSPGRHIQPNVDLNDYDALLALDENNHQHTGASEGQINNLLQSVVQSNSIEEPCVVCLENPSVGDTIRHLPCFHKFHKECIDEWLRRKKLCPICKSGI